MLSLFVCFVFACLVTTIMLVWFKSDAVIEYARLLRLKSLVRNFKDARIEAAPETFNFPHYLRKKYDGWLTRMLFCPLCFCICFTTTIISGITILLLNPVILVAIPVIVVMSLILYGIITKLINL
jgi:cytochrome b subunit of formate dehydrogenase